MAAKVMTATWLQTQAALGSKLGAKDRVCPVALELLCRQSLSLWQGIAQAHVVKKHDLLMNWASMVTLRPGASTAADHLLLQLSQQLRAVCMSCIELGVWS